MTRVWLKHPKTGGYFHCPAAAVPGWVEMGWEPAEAPPVPPNPAVAETLAWRAAQAAQHETKPIKPAKSGAPAAGSDKKE